MFTVKEIFLTSQGEGANIGRTAVFVRFSGCNLWSGREKDRSSAVCKFCDTDFVGGKKYNSAQEIVDVAVDLWKGDDRFRMVVFTGGEPGLQLTENLVDIFLRSGFYTCIETNGTVKLPSNLDWVCVSPKANTQLVVDKANELKIVFPQNNLDPVSFENYESTFKWLSPMDSPELKRNMRMAAQYCKNNPAWRLGIQAHKTWSIP